MRQIICVVCEKRGAISSTSVTEEEAYDRDSEPWEAMRMHLLKNHPVEVLLELCKVEGINPGDWS